MYVCECACSLRVCRTVGEAAAEAFTTHTTGHNGSYFPHRESPQVCACVSLLDAFWQEILLVLETKSPTKPHQGPMITLNDTGAYLALVAEAGAEKNIAISFYTVNFSCLSVL